ncbi:MAG: ADP-ribosylglycohydrolase family protein [Bacilli bacterium]|nr:ADP-ribosylglycohydrolase family protein [Bacilli bacterium]
MLGAIIGDMVGSTYEFHPIKTKKFNIFNPNSHMTDDSYLTMAVARALLKHYPIQYNEEGIKAIKRELINEFVNTWRCFRTAGYGYMFYQWCERAYVTRDVGPYYSFGNGGAMRISPVGWIANNEGEVKMLSKAVTEITHNHPEALKAAEAVAMCIYLARNGYSKGQLKKRMVDEYYPEIAFYNFDKLVETCTFSSKSQDSVPQAIYCFLISDSEEDAIRNAVALGADSDTQACIAGSIAEAFYQRDKLSEFEDKYLYLMIDPEVEQLIKELHDKIGSEKFNKENNNE